MAKRPDGSTVVPSVTDFLGNVISGADLVLVVGVSGSSPYVWLAQVVEVVELARRTWGNGQVAALEYKVLAQPVHPKAYSGWLRHSWDTETNVITGQNEFVGPPRPVWIKSENVVRTVQGLAPVLDKGWNEP